MAKKKTKKVKKSIPMRIEYTYPLVISCGASKIDTEGKKVPAYQLYAKGYWNIFRLSVPSIPVRGTKVFVLSAKYGLIPYNRKIATYDKVVTRNKKVNKEATTPEITSEDLSKKIIKQTESWIGSKNILFIGGEQYKDALELAGFKPFRIDEFKAFPDHNKDAGVGRQNGALKWYLTNILPQLPAYKRKLRAEMVKKSQHILLESLASRFSNRQYFEDMGKTHYEIFGSLPTDITKGAKTKSSRRKLRERVLKYDPYEWARKFLDKIHDIQDQYIEGIQISEIIKLYMGEGTENYFSSIEDFYESSAYMEEDDLERWYGIPKVKADGSPIYDRFAFLELAIRVFEQDRDLSYAIREFLISQEKARYRHLCDMENTSKANRQYCKSDGYTERLEKVKEEIQKAMEKSSRVVNRYPVYDKSYEELMSEYTKDLDEYPSKLEEYEKKIDEINKEEREARKELWTTQREKLDNTSYLERKRAIPVPKKPTMPEFFETTVQQKMGRDTYVLLLDFLGRFLAGKEDRLILSPITKEEAFEYIKKHHSALPEANFRGLMMVLAVQDIDGNIGAVATVNTPTGRWDRAERGENFDYKNVIELTRVASDGSIKGASSMLTSRVIDLLPFLKRGDPNKDDLFVTYSLDSEEGTSYLALRDKGLRPTEYFKGTTASHGSRGAGDLEKSLGDIDKIRWEAGSGAIEGNWDLLNLVGKKK